MGPLTRLATKKMRQMETICPPYRYQSMLSCPQTPTTIRGKIFISFIMFDSLQLNLYLKHSNEFLKFYLFQ